MTLGPVGALTGAFGLIAGAWAGIAGNGCARDVEGAVDAEAEVMYDLFWRVEYKSSVNGLASTQYQ